MYLAVGKEEESGNLRMKPEGCRRHPVCPWLCGFTKCEVPILSSVHKQETGTSGCWTVRAVGTTGVRLQTLKTLGHRKDSFPWTTPHSGSPGDTEHSDTRVTPVAYKEPYFTQDKARFSGCGRSGTFHSFMACLKGLTALGRFKVLASLHMVVTPSSGLWGLDGLTFPVFSLQWG